MLCHISKMKDKRLAKISTFGSQITSVISVALVLLILGILAMALQASRSLSDDIRSNVSFVVKLAPTASDADINRVKSLVGATPGVASFVFASPESILAEESRLMGEDYARSLDENPFGAEFEIKMKPEYASGDSIATVSARIAADAAVAETVSESAVIDSVNSALRRLSVVLLAIASALLVISFVLINNTVSLAVYSRRFIIHTMKLVGATGAFIRRPFVLAGIATGLVAAAVAIVLLAGIRLYATTFDPSVENILPWQSMAIIFVVVTVAGVLICSAASAIATNRYLRTDYDDMFK